MIFQYTSDKVLSGEKTQTRRLVKPGDFDILDVSGDILEVWGVSARYQHPRWQFKRWQYGKSYAVQPMRGVKSIGRIKVTDLRREDVRLITDEDVKAEGFDTWYAFMLKWCEMHDNVVYRAHMKALELYPDRLNVDRFRFIFQECTIPMQPARFYDAWVIDFKFVEVY